VLLHYVFFDEKVSLYVCQVFVKGAVPWISFLHFDIDSYEASQLKAKLGGKDADQENLAVAHRQMLFHLIRIRTVVTK
jgi:hypothetical protein